MNNWRELFFDKSLCSGKVINNGSGNITVTGHLKEGNMNSKIMFFAANPPKVLSQGFSARGLPYPNPETAFENTPNKGAVKIEGGKFEFRVQYPNSYYAGLGSLLIPPSVFVKVCEANGSNDVNIIELGKAIPFRLLTYPTGHDSVPRENPHFYSGREQLPVRTQEDILRASGYPEKNATPNNFWGGAVPHE